MTFPITPDYLADAPEGLISLYYTLEEDILKYICEQFKNAGTANATAIELIRLLQKRGLPLDEIEKRIKQATGLTQKKIDAIFEDAVKRNQAYYTDVLDKMGLVYNEANKSAMQAEISAIRQQAGDALNISNSLGFAVRNYDGSVTFSPIAEAYQKVLNKAEISIWSGATDYNTAIRTAVKELTDSGIQVVDYATGHHDRVDVAARRAIMTGITQISAKYSDALMEEVGTEYVEVTAHRGARDKDGPKGWENHKAWQGRVYSTKDGDSKYPNVYTVCGLGDVAGLCGANCRHHFFPFVPDVMEPTYTAEELENIDPQPFTFEGKEYTMYEATQKQRKIEAALRNIKRRMIGMKAAGKDDQYAAAAVKMKLLNDKYEAFCKAADLRPQRERTFIPQFTPQDYKQSMKAAKKSVANVNQSGIMYPTSNMLAQEGRSVEIPDGYDDFSEFHSLNISHDQIKQFNSIRKLSDENGYEYGVGYLNGKWEEPFTSENIGNVTIPKKYFDNIDSVVFHSHTNATMFSAEDIGFLVTNKIQKIGVITSNKDVFIARKQYDFQVEIDEFKDIRKNISNEVNKILLSNQDFYSWTPNQAKYMAVRIQSLLLAKEFDLILEGGRI